MHRILLTFLALLLSQPTPCSAETFQEIADRAKPGTLGIAVYDFTTGAIQGVNLSRQFPLQSVFKAFLAATVLSQVDSGLLSLDKPITLTPSDLCDGVGSIDNSKGGVFSVKELLQTTLIQSDNSAADALLRLVGGPAVVTAWLRNRGISGIRVDRDERTLEREEDGIPKDLFPDKNASTLRNQVSEAAHRAAFELAKSDPRDTATPQGTIQFLIALKKGSLLTPASTELLLGWLREVKTGPKRLKAGFSSQTDLLHKTGTSGTFDGITLATNDIGVATLSNGHTLAIAAFLANSPASAETRDDLLAACARVATQLK